MYLKKKKHAKHGIGCQRIVLGIFIIHNLYHESSPKGQKYFLEAIINDLTLSSMTCSTYKMSCTNKFP